MWRSDNCEGEPSFNLTVEHFRVFLIRETFQGIVRMGENVGERFEGQSSQFRQPENTRFDGVPELKPIVCDGYRSVNDPPPANLSMLSSLQWRQALFNPFSDASTCEKIPSGRFEEVGARPDEPWRW